MVSQFLRASALLAAILSPVMQPAALPGAGTVTDAAGKPIAGVRVNSWPWQDSRTDATGHYTLTKPNDLVRFSMTGYRPVTRMLSSLNTPVILEPALERPRAVPNCSEAVNRDKRQ